MFVGPVGFAGERLPLGQGLIKDRLQRILGGEPLPQGLQRRVQSFQRGGHRDGFGHGFLEWIFSRR